MLQQPAIAAALRRDQSPHRSLTPRVLREHPFACRVEQTLINGVFDRLVLWSRGDRLEHAEIFDFKTDEIADDAELAAATENYRTQLDLYRRAVTQIFGLPTDNISARLLFVNPGRVIDV
jgi:ATP-dependent exoDNAse (exonuclease V) beta subunit